MPALIVSTSTPDGSAGEYTESRLARGGWGSGGTGSLRPVGLVGAGGGFALDAGCLPLTAFGGGAGRGTCFGGVHVYGDLGTLSGLLRCM